MAAFYTREEHRQNGRLLHEEETQRPVRLIHVEGTCLITLANSEDIQPSKILLLFTIAGKMEAVAVFHTRMEQKGFVCILQEDGTPLKSPKLFRTI
jgi:hypothetical protein